MWNVQEADLEKAALLGIEKTEEFWKSIDMPVTIGQMSIGVLADEVLYKMADLATKGDTALLGTFKKMNRQDMYNIYKMANHK